MTKQTVTIVTITQQEVEEFLVVDEGVKCPVAECGAVNEVAEVDYGMRVNDVEVEVDESGTGVYPDDGERDFETAHWMCKACSATLAMPTTVDVVFG